MFLISNQAGQLYCKNSKNPIWEYYCSEELCLLSSVQSSELELIFTSTRTDNGSKLFLLDLINGEAILTTETKSSVRISAGRKNMLLLGMEDGKIIILEMDLLLRRLKGDSDDIDSERNKMLEKLRKLRK